MPLPTTDRPKPSPQAIAAPPQFTYSYFRSIRDAAGTWDKAAPEKDIFLQREYLEAIEANPPKGVRQGYIVFYKNQHPIGVALCQIKHFSGKDSLRVEVAENASFLERLSAFFRRSIARCVRFQVLICGNLLETGEHAFHFDRHQIAPERSMELLDEAMLHVRSILKKEGIRVQVQLYKDISPANEPERSTLRSEDCLEFVIQPNMVLPLAFDSFEDYLWAMTTKYRTRAKRAFKKAKGIEKRELNTDEIIQHESTLFRQYKSISDSAEFNMVELSATYFSGMKKALLDRFRVFGYFLEDKLIAFYSTIDNHGSFEAHFLGYEHELNHEKQLYLNMLYDIVRLAIKGQCHEVVFARTALEIKSSIGAVPSQLYCFVRHKDLLVNRLGRVVFRCMNTEEVWQQRHPFKQEGA